MLQFYLSGSSQERRIAARAWLRNTSAAEDVLLIAADREAADELAWGLAKESGAVFGIHRFSLTGLAAVLALPQLAGRGFAPATVLGSEAVAMRAAFKVMAASELPTLAPIAALPGFPRALARTLGELRRAGIGADAVRARGLIEMAAIADAFDRDLAGNRLADATELFACAAEALPHSIFASGGVPLLLLDVPVREPVERTLVRSLVAGRQRILWTIPVGDDRARDAAEAFGLTPLPEAEPERSPLSRLREYVFSDMPPPHGEVGDSVQFFSAPGEARECVEIARRVLDHARAGTAFDAMAVFVRSPEVYTPHLQSAFRRAGVPAYFARGTRRPDPSGRAFLALLACRAERLSANRFAEYLSFAQVPNLGNTGDPQTGQRWFAPADDALGPAATKMAHDAPLSLLDADPDFGPTASPGSVPTNSPDSATESAEDDQGTLPAPWKWEEYLVEAAVIGGLDRWKRRLAGLDAELGRRRAALGAAEPDSPTLDAIDRDLEQLGHLQRFALPVIDDLDRLPAAAPWGDWLEALTALAPRVLRRPERVMRALAEMHPMSDVGPVGIDEVRAVLEPRLRQLEVEPPARRFGRVFIGTPDHARGRSFELVFVPGLAERLFPQRPREDPLLLDDHRRALDAGLERQEDRAQRERLLLRLAVGAATRGIVLSYPRMEAAEARPRVPSFYGLDLMRAALGALPAYETLERDAAAAGEARLAWPAPREPERAIDTIEHDLSVLGALLGSGETGRGRARYLLELSPELRRSLTSRFRRWRPKWTPEDGLVRSTPELEPILARFRPNRRSYSATGLQRFATCPYQFLLASIHRLEPRRKAAPLIRMDPLTRGSMFHEIQAALLADLGTAGALPVTPEHVTLAVELLDRATERISAAWRDDVAPAIPRVWEDEVRAMGADLRVWLQRLCGDAATWTPIHSELAFGVGPARGQKSALSGARPGPVTLEGGWQLHGAIDLVERSADGAWLRITDHKTGRVNVNPGCRIGGGEVLQPVLYSLAAEVMLGTSPREGRLFFCTARGGYEVHTVPIDQAAREDAKNVFEVLDDAIVRGALPPAPRPDACKWCDFRSVCGPNEERRLRVKQHAMLEKLTELRQRQ